MRSELRKYPDDRPILVTGGAGFIGSNFVHRWLARYGGPLVVLDKLTYAGNSENLSDLSSNAEFAMIVGDIGDHGLVSRLLVEHEPWAVINFAAESHVDRSIFGPADFLQTNVLGSFNLLEAIRSYWQSLGETPKERFRFLHVSTDEVYGSLGPADPPFHEASPYAPNSPYAASKAAADHFVRAFHRTYGVPALITNCSNNYGPYQFPEKLVPLMIRNAMDGQPLRVYGDGLNVRDWLYVDDHCDAIMAVLGHGRVGEVYNIGGNRQCANIDVVRRICRLLDEHRPDAPVYPHERLITYVADRPGHDRRYAVDSTKVCAELGWHPQVPFEEGIRKTVQWYLANWDWMQRATQGEYRSGIARDYGRRGA